jgi:hypothetical protein
MRIFLRFDPQKWIPESAVSWRKRRIKSQLSLESREGQP